METKEILLKLRNKAGLSQEELAEKVYVTRQAVSRWETGETLPNTETLKQLSRLYNVSINTLLGSPRKLICQCCGMPLEDDIMAKETDGNSTSSGRTARRPSINGWNATTSPPSARMRSARTTTAGDAARGRLGGARKHSHRRLTAQGGSRWPTMMRT